MADVMKTNVDNNSHRAAKPEGHEMLLIANESRLHDKLTNGEWISSYAGSRNGLPKGLYDLTGAERPAKTAATKTYEGNVMHVTDKHVYQLQAAAVAKGKPTLVRHDKSLYKEPPPVGSMTKVDYVRGAGTVTGREQTQER